jgi:outer membrane protein, heavy metal efflux system
MSCRTHLCVAWVTVFLWCPSGAAQALTEKDLLRRFDQENRRARALGARTGAVQAEMKLRTLPPTPGVSYSREDAAGSKEDYLVVEQQVPLSGRLGLLRQAGEAAVNAQKEQSNYALHLLHSDLRLAFIELLHSQQREAAIQKSLGELQEVVRVLREREREGEGSAFDRLRAERELAEVQADLISAQAMTVRSQTQVASFLASGTESRTLVAQGQLEIGRPLPDLANLVSRALEVRGDYKAQEQQLQQLVWERRAAERLRIPEPIVSAGMKRVATASFADTGHIVSVSVPLPFFNRSRREAAVANANFTRTQAEKQALQQQIASEVKAAYEATEQRRRLAQDYKREVGEKNIELTRVARIAYQEGEHRILELLDAFRVTLSSELRVLDLVAAARLAEIELERAVGEEVFP